MPESQAHGKTWERQLGLNVYKATEAELDAISHTAAIDVPRAINRLDGSDISIKVTGKETIDMADIIRVYDEVSGPDTIRMTVIRYEQAAPTIKKLKSITEVDLTNSVALLFGSVTRAELEALVIAAKSVGKVRPDVHADVRAARIAAAYAMRDALHAKTGIMHFHLMFYTNNPSRVQGQFKNFSRFVADHPARIIASSTTGNFRGGAIQEEIVSTIRVRHRKTPAPGSAPHSPPI